MRSLRGCDLVIDRITVKSRLARISKSIDRLERLAETPRELFLVTDSDLPAIAESHLRRSLEAMFDIGRHLLANSGRPELASEYKSIATGLARLGIVPPDFEDALVSMAGYRNRLVHVYHEVSDEELYLIIQHKLGDLRRFVEAIKSYLDTVE